MGVLAAVGVIVGGCSTGDDVTTTESATLGSIQQASVECADGYSFGGTVKYTCSPQVKKAFLGGEQDPTTDGMEITCPKPVVTCEVTENEAPSTTCDALVPAGQVPPSGYAGYCSGTPEDFHVAAPGADNPIKVPCPEGFECKKLDKYALWHECEKAYLTKQRKNEADVSYLASLCVAGAAKSPEQSLSCCKKNYVPTPPKNPEKQDGTFIAKDLPAP